jgi:hypothetical protein
LNATSLNSGARFFFSSAEVGEWILGSFRHDEINEIWERRRLLNGVSAEKLKLKKSSISLGSWFSEHEKIKTFKRDNKLQPIEPPSEFKNLFGVDGFPGLLPEADFGRLRLAKLHSWYIRLGPQQNASGGLTVDEHINRFWNHLMKMDESLTKTLKNRTENNIFLRDELLDFILEVYLFRSAAVMSPSLKNDWDNLSLGEAVGASACFPPVFPPLQVLGLYDDLHVSRLGLTDGGVYDNIGWMALLDEECNYIVASDTSGLFGITERVSAGRLSMVARITSILMADVAWSQSERMHEKYQVWRQIKDLLAKCGADIPGLDKLLQVHSLNGLAYFHINSKPAKIPENQPPVLESKLNRKALASIRTDLDGFGEVEIAALVNHGYITADSYLRREFNGNNPYYNKTYWEENPRLPYQLVDTDVVSKIIKIGKSRFCRALKLKAPLTWGVTLLFLAVVFNVIWRNRHTPISFHGVLSWCSEMVTRSLESSISMFGTDWSKYQFSLGNVLLILLMVVLVWIGIRWVFGFNLVEYLKRKRYISLARKIAWIAKWTRGSCGNLLWPIGGAPVVIALISFIYSLISYIFFHLPFMAKTKIR